MWYILGAIIILYIGHLMHKRTDNNEAYDRDYGNILNAGLTPQEELRKFALVVFNKLVPEEKKYLVNQDVAFVLSDTLIKEINSGVTSTTFGNEIPPLVRKCMNELISYCNEQSKLSNDEIKIILEDAQQEYIKQFSE